MIFYLDPNDLVLIEFNVSFDNLFEVMHSSNNFIIEIIMIINNIHSTQHFVHLSKC